MNEEDIAYTECTCQRCGKWYPVRKDSPMVEPVEHLCIIQEPSEEKKDWEKRKYYCEDCGEIGDIKKYCLKHLEENTKPSEPSWEKEFEMKYLVGDFGDFHEKGDVIPLKAIKDFIHEKLKEEREALIQEVISLSDKMESGSETEFNEWRAFKGFRNTLRDKYLSK